MERTLRPRNRRKTDQPSKYVLQEEEEEPFDKSNDGVEEIETTEEGMESEPKRRGLKRKSPEEESKEPTSKKPTPPASEKPLATTTTKEFTACTPAEKVALAANVLKSAITLSTPAKKQGKREPTGPLLSVEEKKLMDEDVLTLLKRFAPKYYVPLPKIWAIPKSQLTTAQSPKT